MKFLSILICAGLIGGSALAQGVGAGLVTYSMGTGAILEKSESDASGDATNDEDFFGTFGIAVEGGFGLQVDATRTRSVFSDVPDGYFEASSVTLHGNFDLGKVVVGVFYGTGESRYLSYQAFERRTQSYGVEASGTFGNWQLVGQAGVTSMQRHYLYFPDPYVARYTEQPMGGVELRYFLGDDTMFSAGLSVMAADLPGNEGLSAQSLRLKAATRLGNSNLFASAEYRYQQFWYDQAYNNQPNRASYTKEGRLLLGVTLVFGDPSPRETYTRANPMLDTALAPSAAVYLEILDP